MSKEADQTATFLDKWHFNAEQIRDAYGNCSLITGLKLAVGTRTGVLFPFLKRLPKGSSVLEVGSGSGLTQYLLAHHLGFHSTGLEYAPKALEEAQSTLRALGYPEVAERQVQGSAESLPFPDNSFEGIYTNDVLAHVPNPEKAVLEMFRVLKPGGRLALHSETCGYYSAKGSWQHAIKSILGFDPWVELDLHISLKTGPELLQILKATGFRIESHYYASESLLLFNFLGPRPDPHLYEKYPQLLNAPLVKFSEVFRRFYEALYKVPGAYRFHQLLLLSLMLLLTRLVRYDTNGVFVLAYKP